MRDQVVSRCLPESAHWRGTDRETGLMGSDEPHGGGRTAHKWLLAFLLAVLLFVCLFVPLGGDRFVRDLAHERLDAHMLAHQRVGVLRCV